MCMGVDINKIFVIHNKFFNPILLVQTEKEMKEDKRQRQHILRLPSETPDVWFVVCVTHVIIELGSSSSSKCNR